ncbi:autotransporter-associated N-terminal domain-containing protein [uncultured Leptotrichia sp.]|uniref:autotransporter-associated N-terminal domain-containing protein n=1 Tax=uncultured Leptotrichia sp. TaxID=159271 RepID=UPI002626C032|nr:autotransporter-associated N-terminal domain-containing protein [uncultured Leptotrichia sp.]
MSNNLRQIAKDLRSFVKRCKDVHYSDSLLISFLITGLLTIAPKLHADVASEQQEITAQTYDAITDLRQSFMRARKENEKSLKGAQSELVQLLKQGDQVIKSPWASFQFGTGFTNNDWGTTYRGRGGKYLEYYRRDNDLTKYVFDKDKHLYGATNLNIPRNQEPDALTINPANVHKPYTPAEVTKLDAMTLPNAPTFSPKAITPNSGYYKPYEFSTTKATFDPANPTTTNLQYTSYDGRNRYNNNNHSTISMSSGVFEKDGYYSTNDTNKHSQTGVRPMTGGLGSPNYTNDVDVSNVTSISNGNMYLGTHVYKHGRYRGDDAADGTTYTNGGVNYIYRSNPNYNGTDGFDYISGVAYKIAHDANLPDDTLGPEYTIRQDWGWFEGSGFNRYWSNSEAEYRNMIINGKILTYGYAQNHDYGFGGYANTYGYQQGTPLQRTSLKSLIFNDGNTMNINGVTFEIGSSTGGTQQNNSASETNGGTTGRAGVYVNQGSATLTTDYQTRYTSIPTSGAFPSDYIKDAAGNKILFGNFNVYGTSNVGAYLKSGSLTSKGYDYIISRDWSDNGNTNNDGIYVESGNLTVENNGTDNSSFIVAGSYNNGINAKGGTSAVDADFDISGSSNNGINAQSGSTVDVDNSSFTVGGSSNNGINAQSGSTVDVDYSSFTVGGSSNNGMVFSNGANSNKLTNITTSVTGTSSNGILFYNGNGSADSSNVTLENLNGSVSGGNSSSIINMHNLANLVFKTTDDNRDTHFAVTGSSIGIDVNNSGLEKKDLKFGTTSNDKVVEMTLTGDRNVGININGGLTNGTETNKEVSIGKDATPANGLDVAVLGDENVVYNNYGYAHKLTIENGKTSMATTALAGNGRIIIGDWNNGKVLGHNKNIIFANQGYVQGSATSHDSSVKLNHIEVAGDENTIAYFAKGNGGYMANNWLGTNNPAVGFFDGNVELQGVIGKYELHNNNGATPSDKISENNVGVYASSGQRQDLKTDIIGQTTPVTLNDLKITNLNIGVGPHAKYTTLVYADNGTVVDVANTNTSVLGVASTISDGQLLDTTNKWGYGVAYDALSDYTTIGYAKGIFDSDANRFLNNMTHGLDTLPSEVKFSSNVDMVSKHGVAYHADAGGKISAKVTRAGGWQSIIGLAEGSNGTTSNGTTYKNMITGEDTTESGSIVVVE